MLDLCGTLELRVETLYCHAAMRALRVTAWTSIPELIRQGVEAWETIELVDGIYFDWGDDGLVYWRENHG
mgnify:CR=1 FL=1